MSNVTQAVALLKQAVALLEGGASAPADRPVSAPGFPSGPSATLKFGKYKGMTLQQIAQTDMNYIGWVADKFGRDDNGRDTNPKFAADNAKVRAEAKAILGQFAETPAAAPEPAPPVGEDDIPF